MENQSCVFPERTPENSERVANAANGRLERCNEFARSLNWEIISINSHLEALRRFRAKALGITGPQWLLLMAVADLDKDHGVPCNAVSKMMHVDPSFVTTQSKLLEKKGLLRRKPSAVDARVVQMSLTAKTYKHLSILAAQQENLDDFVFSPFNDCDLVAFVERLVAVKERLFKARLKATLDFDE